MGVVKKLSLVIALILFACNSWASTYYIDFAEGADTNNGTATETPWKLAPGMTGFAGSYTHAVGDIFVFKGGVTWTAPGSGTFAGRNITIGYSGGSSTPDQYVGGQRCGQIGSPSCNGGSAWGSGYPVFDGSSIGGLMVYAYGKSNLVFDGIKLYNAAMANLGAGQGFNFTSGSNIEVKNCWIESLNINGFSFTVRTGESLSRLYFHDNHIRRVGRIYIVLQAEAFFDDIQMYNNLYEGPGDYGSGSYHYDGFMLGGQGASSYPMTNVKIHHNKFYGDWSVNGTASGVTALIFFTSYAPERPYSAQHVEIYDNVIAYENNAWQGTAGRQVSNMVTTWGNFDDVKIYNNTISGDATVSINEISSMCISMQNGNVSNLSIKNNILSGCSNGIGLPKLQTSEPVIDYNVYNTTSRLVYSDMPAHNGVCQTIAACQTFAGWETHGIKADPLFVALPSGGVAGSGNFSLQVSSPAKNAGLDLSALFTSDYLGKLRPTGANTWDIGAYEYGGSDDTTPPTITTATIGADGDVLTLVFAEPVTVNTSTGFTLNMSGGAAGLIYTSGSGTNTLVYAITGRNIDTAETGTLDYASVANGIEDAAGNDLASTGESDEAVTNDSEYTPSATTYIVTIQSSGDCIISPFISKIIVSGEAASYTCTAYGNSGCAAWTGTCGGTGTTSFTSSAITSDCTVIQGCYKIAPDVAIGSGGAAVTLGSGAVGTLY
jgi:hypothetical protein